MIDIKLFESPHKDFKYKVKLPLDSNYDIARWWLREKGYGSTDYGIMLGFAEATFYFKSKELAFEFRLINL